MVAVVAVIRPLVVAAVMLRRLARAAVVVVAAVTLPLMPLPVVVQPAPVAVVACKPR